MGRSKIIFFCRSLSRWLTGVSVRDVKITSMTVGVVLLLGITVTLQVCARSAGELGRSLEERGVAIARDLAVRSTGLILTGDRFALYELIRDTLENNPDVCYAFIMDPERVVLVHSFNVGVPHDLLRVNILAPMCPIRFKSSAAKRGSYVTSPCPSSTAGQGWRGWGSLSAAFRLPLCTLSVPF
jgi:hypothetical protein